jgi:carboxylesterase type B
LKKLGGNGPNLGEPILAPPEGSKESENCLFLDLYVPVSALNGTNTLPVVVWFYGGAYLFGSKSAGKDLKLSLPFYSGAGPQSQGDMIFIAGNYRLGAFGWLAGPEFKEAGGTPNVGLTDQRLLLRWVQENARSFGGDPGQVSAWGESAGAGSIMHHITANWTDDYPGDPLFSRAILMSPAFQWQWNNSAGGALDKVYGDFKNKPSVKSCESFSCLQSLPTSNISAANIDLAKKFHTEGIYNIGPAVDGCHITSLPGIALQNCENCECLNHGTED